MAGNTEYKNNWQREHKDTKLLTLPKGRKAEIQAVADAQGESLNDFIIKAIDERMERIQQKIESVTPFTPPPGEVCPEDCKKRCGVIYAGEDRTEKPWCSAYSIEITDYDEQTGKHRKCTECLQDSK